MHMEYGAVEVHEDGTVDVLVGTSAHGQGHDTAFAMIVSELLGVPMDKVRLVQTDTALVPRGQRHDGYAARCRPRAARCIARARSCSTRPSSSPRTCSRRAPTTSCVGDGGLQVAGVPSKLLAWGELAADGEDPSGIEGSTGGLRHELDFDGTGSTFPFGAHIAVVEVDTETGRVEQLRHIAVDDCGRILNPLLVDRPAARRHRAGHRAGAVRVGAVRRRRQPDHREPHGLRDAERGRVPELRDVQHARRRRPSNPLGAKGIGESGTIGSTPAVQNAVVDALSPLGIRHIDMPLTSERVWAAIQAGAWLSVALAPPTLRLTESQYAVIVGNCYDGLPNEACGLLIGPMLDGAADRRDQRGAAVRRTPTRRRARTPSRRRTCCGAMRAAEERGEEIVGVWHSHTHTDAVPVADRRAPGRRPVVDLRDRQPQARRSGHCAPTRSSTSTITELPVELTRG